LLSQIGLAVEVIADIFLSCTLSLQATARSAFEEVSSNRDGVPLKVNFIQMVEQFLLLWLAVLPQSLFLLKPLDIVELDEAMDIAKN